MHRTDGLDAGILCGTIDNAENVQLQRAFERSGLKCAQMLPEDVSIGASLQPAFLHDAVNVDAVPGFIVRGIGVTTLTRSFYRFDVLYALERRGKVLINGARATEVAMNKAMASVAIDAAGIPTPATVVTENLKHAIAAFDRLGGDVVIKPVYGSLGIGMFRIQDKGVAEHLLVELFRNGCAFYMQQFHPWSSPVGIAASHPFDVRALVIGGEVAGAMIRESPDASQWKTNVHQGAEPRPFSPSREVQNLAIEAAAAIGLEVAGVDLLHSARAGGWVVLEANCAPGWTGLSRACPADIPARIVEYYREKLKR
ncbi:MAG: RimK family alpha-L-glutamate ligase [Candidatus Lokiarchaeota archaeon]|nr:RimK family alpha-L-glutamate ligase [Candidatus Lokiarchaeota archaeon]